MKKHWETVYRKKAPDEVTWYQAYPSSSLVLLERTDVGPGSRIIDVGGGASNLADHLVSKGFDRLAVLDISGAALEASVRRLGANAALVRWIEADITQYLFDEEFDVWHDRASFHFLTAPEDRRAYLRAMGKTLRPGGHVVLSTFGPEGPTRCSGLPVVRYSPASLHAQLGGDYDLLESRNEVHVAPTGHRQQFIYCLFRKNG